MMAASLHTIPPFLTFPAIIAMDSLEEKKIFHAFECINGTKVNVAVNLVNKFPDSIFKTLMDEGESYTGLSFEDLKYLVFYMKNAAKGTQVHSDFLNPEQFLSVTQANLPLFSETKRTSHVTIHMGDGRQVSRVVTPFWVSNRFREVLTGGIKGYDEATRYARLTFPYSPFSRKTKSFRMEIPNFMLKDYTLKVVHLIYYNDWTFSSIKGMQLKDADFVDEVTARLLSGSMKAFKYRHSISQIRTMMRVSIAIRD